MEASFSSDTNLHGELLLDRSQRALSRPAIRFRGAELSYEKLVGCVEAMARELGQVGVAPGDRVLLAASNSPRYVAAFLAILAAGGIAVPIDRGLGPSRLGLLVEDTGPKLCVAEPEQIEVSGVTVPCRFLADDPRRGPILTGAEPREPRRSELPAVSGEADAVILYTSGSTGAPKGVPLTHRQLLAIAANLGAIVGMDAEHRELALSPMTHSGGWQRITATLLAGGCVTIAGGMPSVPGLLEDAAEDRIRGFFTPPPLLRALLRTAPERVRAGLASCSSIETASAPLAGSELRALLDLLPETRVLVQYGLTECSRAVMLDAREHPDRLHTVGRPTPGTEIAVRDPGGRIGSNRIHGEILLRGPQLLHGYWNRPDLDRDRFHDGWLRTGDEGSLDEQGFLSLQGRRDDRINCGGYSFFPAEVEGELAPIEGVVEVLVAGVADPSGLLGQVPWAFVVPAPDAAWSARSFLHEARRRLPAHMVPRRVVELDTLPRTPRGKPDRRLVVELHGPSSPSSKES